jgi:predicted ester cyclase
MPLIEQVHRFFVALNAKDKDTVVAMFTPPAQIRSPIGSFTGGEAYWDWMLMHWRALPDFTHEIRGLAVESGDTVAFELHAFGTMTGPLALPGGDAAPTGRRIDIPAADFWRFEDGLIAEYHLYFDGVEFFRQLGINQPQEPGV